MMPSHQVESLLEPGDILFTSIPNFLYRRVAQATGSLCSHVGIAFYDPEAGWLVAESAVPTVRYVSIANFISRSDKGWLVVRRIHGGLSPDQAESLRKECNTRMGKLYHLGFHYLSSRQFCSKFVYETYLAALGVEVGNLESFRTLLDSQPNTPLLFWHLWFLGRIPWPRLTVTPASQLTSGQLETVWEMPYPQTHNKGLRTCFKSVASSLIARRTEHRNRNVLDVHEDFEHRATQQSDCVAAFKTRS